jgi:D-3-phosphoglycerate dehydrogenase
MERELLAQAGADLVVAEGGRDAALALAADADALLNTYLPLDAEFLAAVPKCKIVARYGIGTDNIDVTAARSAGIVVTNVPDYCVEEVATHALSLIFTLVRRIPEAQQELLAGHWGVDGIRPVHRLSELTVGLLGLGRIARTVAAVVCQLGVQVVAFDPYVTAEVPGVSLVGFDELLARSNVLSLHAPLTPETRGVIDAAALAALPTGAVLVNTSRGPLVQFAALVDALESGHLAGAGLDVFEVEPPDPKAVEGVRGLIATPHTAFYSEASLRESQLKAVTQVLKVLAGDQPDYEVRA